MIRIYIFLTIVGVLTGIGYGAKSYYTWSQNTISTLRENNAKMELANQTMQNTINRMAEEAAKNEQLNRELTKALQDSQKHLDALRTVFAKIDLTMEALTDAQNLEDRVNRAVSRLLDNIKRETTPPSNEPVVTDSVQSDN